MLSSVFSQIFEKIFLSRFDAEQFKNRRWHWTGVAARVFPAQPRASYRVHYGRRLPLRQLRRFTGGTDFICRGRPHGGSIHVSVSPAQHSGITHFSPSCSICRPDDRRHLAVDAHGDGRQPFETGWLIGNVNIAPVRAFSLAGVIIYSLRMLSSFFVKFVKRVEKKIKLKTVSAVA
jgi:hypothetical protein